jgi:hypothetical protein
MTEEASVIPSNTCDPVFSSSVTPDDMKKREKAYWELKEKLSLEEDEWKMVDFIISEIDKQARTDPPEQPTRGERM